MTVDQLEQEALKLSPEQRARLAKLLIDSLDADDDVERDWIAEARRRDAEMSSGEVSGIPLETVRERARDRFGE